MKSVAHLGTPPMVAVLVGSGAGGATLAFPKEGNENAFFGAATAFTTGFFPITIAETLLETRKRMMARNERMVSVNER